MNITILELIQNYGFDSVLTAATVCILTGLIKMPIKSLASKTKNSKKYTKYITFLPLFLGFGVTVLYEFILTKEVLFTVDFMTLWLTSSSLSLAIYAFIEKFIPNKKKILSAEEIKQNEEMLDTIKSYLMADKQCEETEKSTVTIAETTEKSQDLTTAERETQVHESVRGKIILRGRKNA